MLLVAYIIMAYHKNMWAVLILLVTYLAQAVRVCVYPIVVCVTESCLVQLPRKMLDVFAGAAVMVHIPVARYRQFV